MNLMNGCPLKPMRILATDSVSWFGLMPCKVGLWEVLLQVVGGYPTKPLGVFPPSHTPQNSQQKQLTSYFPRRNLYLPQSFRANLAVKEDITVCHWEVSKVDYH